MELTLLDQYTQNSKNLPACDEKNCSILSSFQYTSSVTAYFVTEKMLFFTALLIYYGYHSGEGAQTPVNCSTSLLFCYFKDRRHTKRLSLVSFDFNGDQESKS